jgi:predicted nucleotidyltransferase
MPITTEDILPQIVRRLVEEFDPEEIILFGSRAWGQPRPDSDYDLLIIVSDAHEQPTRRATRGYLRLRGVPVPADLVVSTRAEFDRYRRVPASLEATILERGKVLYARGQARVGPDDRVTRDSREYEMKECDS